MNYILYFIISFFLAALITPMVKRLAFRYRIIDTPSEPRKIHKNPTPLMGGLAVYVSFLIALLIYLNIDPVNFNIVPVKFFLSIIFGGAILLIGGIIDDKYNLPPKFLWLFPALASLVVVLSGIGVGIDHISNPFGDSISLNFKIAGIPFSYFFIWFWMMGMIFTTKFLDGLDGLCSGIALIGGLTMFALSLTEKINQPITAQISIIFTGTLAGYLIYAFNPASIFLGEGGSTFLGFMLGILSVILGGKIATALLVMGIPILDVAWVITKRLWYGQSPFKGDRQHLHFKLLDIGLTQRQAVLVLYGLSAIFGTIAVFLQSLGKLIALGVLFVVMLILALGTVIIYKRKHPHIPDLFEYAQNKDK